MVEPPTPDDLRRLAQKAAGQIHVSMGSDLLDSEVTGHVPTGWSLLDLNMNGGLPVGRITEIYGREATAKSSLLYLAMANCQKGGGIAILLDSESTFNKDLATTYGVDVDRVTLLPPETALEDAFPTLLSLIRAFKGGYPECTILIGWDTLAASPTTDEVEKGESGEQRGMMPQYRAKVIRQGLRLISYEIARSKICFVVINQAYEKMTPTGVPLLETPGGLAPRYYTTVRISLKSIGLLKQADDLPPVGMRVQAKFEKNKLSSPRREVISRFYYGRGFDDPLSILDYAVDNKIVKKSGPWNSFPFDGKDIKFYDSKFAEVLSNNPGMLESIKNQVFEHYKAFSLATK